MCRNNKNRKRDYRNLVDYFGFTPNKFVARTLLACFQLTQWFYVCTPTQIHVHNIYICFRILKCQMLSVIRTPISTDDESA